MEKQTGKFVAGSCLGGVLGAIPGVFLGGWLAVAIFTWASEPPTPPRNHMHLDMGSLVYTLLWLVVGAVCGGILGAVGGGMFGVALTSSGADSQESERGPGGPAEQPQKTGPQGRDSDRPEAPQPQVNVRCRKCGSLNDETVSLCNQCGAAI